MIPIEIIEEVKGREIEQDRIEERKEEEIFQATPLEKDKGSIEQERIEEGSIPKEIEETVTREEKVEEEVAQEPRIYPSFI